MINKQELEQAWREIELAKYTTGELIEELARRGLVVDTKEYKERHTEAYNKAEGIK